MSIFQKSVENKYLSDLDPVLIDAKYQAFQEYFGNPEIQENIRNSKEEQFQTGFLIELFVEILGYTLNPDPDFNLTTELKNIKDAKKTDGAILKDGNAVAVIELKSTSTSDLDFVEDQAFGYKNNQPKCVYVITSNFEKLRMYIQDAVEHIEFNLFELSKNRFSLLWLCLAKDNILRDVPLRIKKLSLVQEENITKRMYADYAKFREFVYESMVANNTEKDKHLLFNKTQKLLDRFLFVFFAEDRLLLPPNSISEIVRQWAELKDEYDEYFPLYERFKKYFAYLNTGHKGKHYEIYPYNGGLFETDDILDNVILDDDILHEHALRLSAYDYQSEVDVNVLGHIFENSLSDIEAIKAEIDGRSIDRQKNKRKRDGVFYTPKYITKYMIENTVGKLCYEKRMELGIVDEEYSPNQKKATKAILLKKLDAYREWLFEFTILDPACGSGAFLNQALDFLINEHQKIDTLKSKLLGESLVFSDIEKEILENNIYGVDINEESVEIAKLSLWLRTASKGRKLNRLSSSIKCGNSLIDNPEIGGAKAFDWENEFPEVFVKGGFDIVIGNPPYVRLETIKESSRALAKCGYETYTKRGDIYCLFVEKGVNLLRSGGVISYIMSNKWLQSAYGKPLRRLLLSYNLLELIDFGDIQVFEDATTYPCIVTATKADPDERISVSILKESNDLEFKYNVIESSEYFNRASFSSETWVISSTKEQHLLDKLSKKYSKLSDFIDGEAYYGVKTGLSKAFMIDEETKNAIVSSDIHAETRIKPFLQGRDITRYAIPTPRSYLIIFERGITKEHIKDDSEAKAREWLNEEYPSIISWLSPFETKGKNRTDKGDYWWELRSCDYYDKFAQPKIMYQTFQVTPCFIYDESGLYCNNSMWIIPTDNKALLGVLNSKMGWWLISKYCTQIKNGFQLIWEYFRKIPIPNISNSSLTELVDKMLASSKEHAELTKSFVNYIQIKYAQKKVSKKLGNWPELTKVEFLKELNSVVKSVKGDSLSLSDEMNWIELFNSKRKEVEAIKSESLRLDKDIDNAVYKLYELSSNEIQFIEGSF